MAMPVLSASTDKSVYTPGETIVLTVNYSDAGADVVVTDPPVNHVTTIHGTDEAGNDSVITVGYGIGGGSHVVHQAHAVTLAVTDDVGHAYSKVSDTGSVAVFHATA